MLEEEIKYYSESLPTLLEKHSGQIALIKGRELIGVFNTEEEALAEGARRYGLEPFLVRRIQEKQPDISIPALTLGILYADPTHASHCSSQEL